MITVIGGTYREVDYDDISIEIFGSGFRGAKFLLENKCSVDFYTSGNNETLRFLTENQKVYKGFSFKCEYHEELITFKYSFALDEPVIFPGLTNISKTREFDIQAENVLAFGMLESDYKINGDKVVYDPQTAVKPKRFSGIGNAKELVYIVNLIEAQSLASSVDIEDIKKYFFDEEKAKAIIIKNGPQGATLYLGNSNVRIPAYVTKNVNKIGSGDIFTSSFCYYWMVEGFSIEDSAINASKSTAYFCDKKVYVSSSRITDFAYEEFKTTELAAKQIYLASPFFSISELILIDKVRSAFLGFGVKVFSPFHDIGLGDDIEIAKKDIEGLNNSEIVFCVLDNLDSGTLIEAGYALANKKKVIGYHRTCDENKLLMFNGGNTTIFKHLTTAMYQTIWNL
ncbi:PfkB family carbohydrate kinase [Niabella sp. CJ426]|uniref:PfkB family carbohydrate kinase n=1 Tax=Niabella sp. CJ426 TaxID=3393740 RepID=UPI003CFE9542